MEKVLVIDPQGKNLGQHDLEAAEKMAFNYGMDLVEVRPNVYKILNLGKLQYEASKRKQVKAKSVKEMKFKLNIADNDFATKIGHIRKFIQSGHTVKVTIWFSGREVNRPEDGINLMEDIESAVEDIATVSMNTELQGKNMYMSITPGVKK